MTDPNIVERRGPRCVQNVVRKMKLPPGYNQEALHQLADMADAQATIIRMLLEREAQNIARADKRAEADATTIRELADALRETTDRVSVYAGVKGDTLVPRNRALLSRLNMEEPHHETDPHPMEGE